MTDPTGRSFLSYRRARKDEAALLIAALHDRGIPTWQDVSDLGSVPTEDEIRRVLADPATASAILFITPEVADSPLIRQVEVPGIIRRAEAGDGFFVVPVAAGGLDYAAAADLAGNHLSAQNLSHWNMHNAAAEAITPDIAAEVAGRVLTQRVQAIHRHLAAGSPLRIGLYVRRAPPVEGGTALALDWTARFTGKEEDGDTWERTLLPALTAIAAAARQHAPGREVEAFGLPTLPAAMALGCAFLSTGGIGLSWQQFTQGRPLQSWSLGLPRAASGFTHRLVSQDAGARDIAVLVSVADDVEPVFAAGRRTLPPLRAVVHVARDGTYPHAIDTPGEAADAAFTVQDAMRAARRAYGNVGTFHMFVAAPAGLAVLIGQLLNTFGSVQTYEHVSADGSGLYRPAALLRPST
jgi:hypothetical protein